MGTQERSPTTTSYKDAVSLITEWWGNERPGGKWIHVADSSGRDGAEVLREVHRTIAGSVLLDATGRTAEELHAEVLEILGVDLSPGSRRNWRMSLRRLGEPRLVLVINAHRAGGTRFSYEPERLLSRTVQGLSGGKAGLVVHSGPVRRSVRAPIAVQVEGQESTNRDWPLPVRALALSEPRTVPLRMWAELAAALTGEQPTESALSEVLAEFPAELASDESGVRFTDESLAEELRRNTGERDIEKVNRHMVRWLRDTSAEFQHPEGWGKHGPEGAYLATGLAMHAARAGYFQGLPADYEGPARVFGDLLRDGQAMANVPQLLLLDAASCASFGTLPGNSAAADASYLWLYGVIPSEQGEWAAWLHLMAAARGDDTFAAAITASGVDLPWKVKWTQWRPPGAYHHRYLSFRACEGMTEVQWQGRPAIASLYDSDESTTLWDPLTGRLLAGPWYGEDIPEEHLSDLSWPDEEEDSGPTTFDELFEAMPDEPSVHELLLAAPPLVLENVTVLGGAGGLFAVKPAAGKPFTGTSSPEVRPLSGPYVGANETTPVDAPPPGPADLIELYGADAFRKFGEENLPTGITDPATRRTLSDIGLPAVDESGMAIYPWGSAGRLPEALDEVSWPSGISAPEETGPLFQIGLWMGGDLVIDGHSGHVLRIPTEPDEEHLEALPAASSLESFLTLLGLWVTGLRLKAAIEDDDEVYLLRQHVQRAQLLIDETGAEAPAWSYAFLND
ncbi:SUKH-4 family immunity protein [Streptomyces lydicus]|uniref:SUKH-4 family immunity protein n=1 Tax=Streptomyces lydicus TaxID=47763 RepID=UPI003330BB93